MKPKSEVCEMNKIEPTSCDLDTQTEPSYGMRLEPLEIKLEPYEEYKMKFDPDTSIVIKDKVVTTRMNKLQKFMLSIILK